MTNQNVRRIRADVRKLILQFDIINFFTSVLEIINVHLHHQDDLYILPHLHKTSFILLAFDTGNNLVELTWRE